MKKAIKTATTILGCMTLGYMGYKVFKFFKDVHIELATGTDTEDDKHTAEELKAEKKSDDGFGLLGEDFDLFTKESTGSDMLEATDDDFAEESGVN